ncbi:MAG: trypsin-like peptidase domain-containing protein [Pirellula sp.]
MIRKAFAAASILLIGMILGWSFQRAGTEPAHASPQREGTATSPFPAQVTRPVNPPILPGTPNPPVPGAAAAPQGAPFPDGFTAMSPEEAINVSVYEQTNRSVVNISTKTIRPEAFLMVSEIEGSGSGSIFDKQGHVLTNYHVIEGAKSIDVTLFNGESFAAELIGQDKDNDLAVLHIAAPESMLVPLTWGDSSNLRVGQHIIAIGNPFGYERTMSTGIISSLNRQIMSKTRRPIRSLIQIDAALNQGNSGGPLLNSRGEMIGMNMAIATRSGDNAGIGFAIPVNTIRRVVPQLLTSGRVLRPTIGIMQVYETDQGLLVVVLTPNGPAERAGIRGSLERRKVRRGVIVLEQEVINHSQADLIIGIDDMRVKHADDLLSVIETKKAGDQVVLTVVRAGKQLQIPVVLGENE